MDPIQMEEEPKRKRKAPISPTTPKKRSKRVSLEEEYMSRFEAIEKKLSGLDALQKALETLTAQLPFKTQHKEDKSPNMEDQTMEESDSDDEILMAKSLKKAIQDDSQLSKGYREIMNIFEAPKVNADSLEHSAFLAVMAVKVERLEQKRNLVEAQRLMNVVKAIYKGIKSEEIVARLLTRVYEIFVMESTGHEAANAVHGFVEGEDKECPNLNKIQETFKAAKVAVTKEKPASMHKAVKKGYQKFGKGTKVEKEKGAAPAAKKTE